MPLRVKLVATTLLLVIVALVGSGAAAAATMRSYLIGRLDSQLATAAQNPVSGVVPPGSDDGHGGGLGSRPSGDGDDRQRLPSAYVVEVTGADGQIVQGPTNNLVDPNQPLPLFPQLTAAQSHAQGTRTQTTGAVNGGGQWRVLSAPVTLSDGSQGTLFVGQSLGDVDGTVGRLTLLLAGIGVCAVVLVAAVGYLIARASLRPLRRVEHTAVAIAAGDLTQRVPDADPRTEVGQLAAALNTMLGEIETAFAERAASEAAARRSEERMRTSETTARRSEARMRRFVADASHELRTPLTSIRGFAELYRQGAVRAEHDVRRLMRRIEDEATRMGLLVEDLLLLARLDQQRPLAQDPVDMLALAADAVHNASAVDPSRPITLDVGRTDPPPIVIGDEPRLRQVLVNLLGNAVQHTPPGTPVTVRVATGTGEHRAGSAVLFDVADEGPGMTPQDAARVFERFYRADEARGPEGGSGLGLAIVSALVAGHGGTVTVETSPGSGCTFRIELPLAAVAAEPLRSGPRPTG
jgi:two-component system, OmpR family, sensor kinase